MTLNLAELYFELAAQQPEHPLILGQEADSQISYAAFKDEIQALAQQLRDAGVQTGDNIGLHYPSGGHYIAFVYAIWACGACVTPLPLELTAAEQEQIFDFVHIDKVICHTRLLAKVKTNIQKETTPLVHQAILTQAISECEAPPELADVNAAFIRFTSGTTGDAKGVVLSHEAIYERILAANKVLHIGPQDRILWLLSMDYHFAVSIVAYLTFGASIVLPKNSFGITLLTAACNHQATFIYGSPTHYILMTQDDSGVELPKELRVCIVTTTALRTEAADAFYERFGRTLNETYGIIELGLPAINISHDRKKQGSVGQITPDYELLLKCPEGESQGEILLRSKGMLDAYYSPWRTRDTILEEHNGWFKTGDLGRLDSDGFLYIVGRSKELISVGGMKFFPEEVETLLEAHPAIQSACVFGIREPQWGESVKSQLVLAEGERAPDDKALRTFCRSSLASHKIPSNFQWVEQLAYTASGKKIRNPQKLNHP